MARTKSSSAWRSARITRRKILVFLVCLFTASVLWVLMAFNGFYTTSIVVPVKYTNMPESNVILENLPQEAELEISGSGYHLLGYTLRPDKAEVVLDGAYIRSQQHDGQLHFFLTTRHGVDYFNRLHSDINALYIRPDTIHFNFFRKAYEKVPVRLKSYLSFDREYGLTDSLRCQPESVTVTAPIEALNRIKVIETAPLVHRNLNKNATFPLKLVKPSREVNLNPEQVNIEVSVGRFTEGRFNIPVSLPDSLQSKIRLFPVQVVRLSYEVSLKDYASIKPSDFVLSVVPSLPGSQAGSRIPLRLIRSPKGVRKVRLEPESLEFIYLRN